MIPRPLTARPAALLVAGGLAAGWLTACEPKAGQAGCEPEEVEGVVATVDGAAWSAGDVSWSDAGDSVHLVSASEGAGWISVVALTTTTGENVVAAMDAGAFPVEITLKTGAEGGFAIWYTEEATSSSTTEGGEGLLTLTSQDGDQLAGCLAFDAGVDGGEVSFADGAFLADPQ